MANTAHSSNTNLSTVFYIVYCKQGRFLAYTDLGDIGNSSEYDSVLDQFVAEYISKGTKLLESLVDSLMS